MAINAGRLGSGWVEKSEARRAISRLESIAGGGRRQTMKATPDMLSAAGIAVVEEPAGTGGEEG